MRGLWGIGLIAGSLFVLSACAAGSSQTDQAAQRVAVAMNAQRHNTAQGYARAALDARSGSSGFSVLVAQDLSAKGPQDAHAHLVFRIHWDATESGWTRTDAVTACYSVDFNHYGLAAGPSRVDCPANASPITPPPTSPVEIPDSFDQPLRSMLAALPGRPTDADVRAALARVMPAASAAPTATVTVQGADVGVAYRTMDADTDNVDCLFGSRVNGTVRVWRPAGVQVRPGELTCSAAEALSLQGTTPPH